MSETKCLVQIELVRMSETTYQNTERTKNKIHSESFMLNECVDTIDKAQLFRWPLSHLQQLTNKYFRAILCFETLKNNAFCVSAQS